MLTFSRTAALINQMVQDQVIPGAIYALIDGAEWHTNQVGVAQIKPTIKPLWPDAMYDLASVTKVVGTTTVAMKLIAPCMTTYRLYSPQRSRFVI